MVHQLKNYESELKLYGMIVDQIHKYSAIFWQFPMAFIATNILALDKFYNYPLIIVFIACFDFIMVYSFQVMVGHSRSLVSAAQKAESILTKAYKDFIPTFQTAKIRATKVTVIGMWIIPIGLIVHAFVIWIGCIFYL